MVRHEYCINDLSIQDLYSTLEKTSANDPVNMPLDETWMVQWSRFFEINETKPNFSRRIGPYLSDGLGNDQIFPAFDETERVGLLYRDLLGAGIAGMWSVDALIAEIANRRPQFIGHVAPACRPRLPRHQLREWLVAAPAYGALTAEDIETLSNDPPLPFFILFEAMQQPQAEGLHLGPLGSIIVSEVIFGALAARSALIRRRRARRSACRSVPRILSDKCFPGNSRHLKHGSIGGVHHRDCRTAAGRACIFVKRNFPSHPTRRSKKMRARKNTSDQP